jgi:ferredoxin--NADP+ reductase
MNSEKYTLERVLSVQPWTPNLVSFRLTRPAGYRFTAGQFARLGLPKIVDESDLPQIVWRAYSIASASQADHLEFCSVILPSGEFTTELVRLAPGDSMYVDRASFGFLTTAGFAPGLDLWMIATGTGLAPFLSILQESAIWQDYENLVVVHSVRQAGELAYRETLEAMCKTPPFGASRARLHYVPIVTRSTEPLYLHERIPELFASGRLEAAAMLQLQLERSRVLLCGNPAMVSEMRTLLGAQGYATSRRQKPGTLCVENYW